MDFKKHLLEDNSICDVCGLRNNDDMYMVNDALWKKAGMTHHMAHLECLEKKLGRRLNYGDFNQYADVPVNEYNPKVQERMNSYGSDFSQYWR